MRACSARTIAATACPFRSRAARASIIGAISSTSTRSCGSTRRVRIGASCISTMRTTCPRFIRASPISDRSAAASILRGASSTIICETCSREARGCPRKSKSCRIGDVIRLCATPRRLGRACPGYPNANAEHSSARRAVASNFRSWQVPHGVDARDKPGHDARGCVRLKIDYRSCRTGQPWDKPGHDVLGLQKAKHCNRILSPDSRARRGERTRQCRLASPAPLCDHPSRNRRRVALRRVGAGASDIGEDETMSKPEPREDTAALLRACLAGEAALARELLAARASVDQQDHFENTPLLLAAFVGDVEILRDLLDYGAAIDHRNDLGETALFVAAAYPIPLAEQSESPLPRHAGHDEVLRELLTRGSATNLRSANNQTAIEAAADKGNIDAALDLLAHGAAFDPDFAFEGDPLRWAAAQGYAALAAALLDRGAALDQPGNDGSTALSHAISSHRHAVTKLLIDRGATIGEADRASLVEWLDWLQARAEEAIERMYDAPDHKAAAGAYDEANEYLGDALGLAERLHWRDAAAWLQARLTQVKTVFRSKFPA